MIELVGSILTALASIPGILKLIQEISGAVTLWFVQRQNNETLAMIADAAALSARATNNEERFKALDAWHAALKRSRVS